MFEFIPHKNNKHSGRTILFSVFVLVVSGLAAFSVQAYSQKLVASGLLEKNENIELAEKIVVNFPLPIVPETVENNFSITPTSKIAMNWENGNRRLIISPESFWEPGVDYVIKITNGKNIFLKQFEQTIAFRTRPLPKIKTIFPAKGEKEVAVDIEEPVRVTFDRPIDGYNVKFVVNPYEDLAYELESDKTAVRLLASSDFKWNTDYSIDILTKRSGQPADKYRMIGQTNFTTAKHVQPSSWDKDLKIRSLQAKEFTNPVLQNGKYVDVNLAQQTMVIFENGKAVDSFIISSGKKGMETPVGEFKIENKTPRAWSKKYSLWMPNWMAIVPSGEIGFHELPVWPGGYQEGANHLGTPVSHGCVRLGPGDAKKVFDWAEIGTPVIIHM